MNWNHLIRTIHRWTSITFVVAVVTYIVAAGHKELAFALGLFALVPLIVLIVNDCKAAYDRMLGLGVEFTQEPVDRFGTVDAGFRDPSGNGWKLIEARGR